MGQQGRRKKSSNREVEKILAAVERQRDAGGQAEFEVRQLRSGHYAVHAAGGAWITNFPGSPGNDARRSILNSLGPLKRAGFKHSR